jgi:hypothetical protein
MKFCILPSGNLLITADNRDREELAYDLRRGARDSAESFVIEAAQYSQYEFTDGGALCALTDAPLIAQDMTVEDDGSRAFYGKVWKYEEYMLRDYLEELARRGRVVFTLGADFAEEAYRVPAPGTPEYSELSAHNYEHCLD